MNRWSVYKWPNHIVFKHRRAFTNFPTAIEISSLPRLPFGGLDYSSISAPNVQIRGYHLTCYFRKWTSATCVRILKAGTDHVYPRISLKSRRALFEERASSNPTCGKRFAHVDDSCCQLVKTILPAYGPGWADRPVLSANLRSPETSALQLYLEDNDKLESQRALSCCTV